MKVDLPTLIMYLIADMNSTDEMSFCPSFRLSDVKKRCFHICDKLKPCSKCLAAGERCDNDS